MAIVLRGLLPALALGLVLSLSGCNEPVQRIDAYNLGELAADPQLTLQYMGSDGIYHYVDLPTREGHISYKVPRNSITLERTFPLGGGAPYRLTPNMMPTDQ